MFSDFVWISQRASLTKSLSGQLLGHAQDVGFADRRVHQEIVNYITEIYAPFTQEEISVKIAQMLTPAEVTCPVELVYQTIEGLHEACPNHSGDWYFSGDYPTPGGTRMVNKAFINYYEGKEMYSL